MIMKAKNILILVFLFISSLCKAQEWVIMTPNGTKINVNTANIELGDSEIERLKNLVRDQYPEAELIDNASRKYNCHGYAWDFTEGGTPKCWIDSYNVHYYWDDGSYVETDESHAEKIFYYAGAYGDTHSAVVSKTHAGKYESKWGTWPLMRHDPDYGPENYNMDYRRYYKRAGSTTLAWSDIYINLTSTGRNVDFEIKFHSDINKIGNFDTKWLVNDDNWGWLSSGPNSAWKFISKPLTSGHLYLVLREQGNFHLYKSPGYKGEYSFRKLTSSKWRFSMDSWPNNGNMFEFVIPIQLQIFQANGTPLIYNIALYCSTWGTESSFTWDYLFPLGRPDTPPSGYNTRAIQDSPEIDDITLLSDKVDIKVYDLSGKLILSKKNVDKNFNITETPLREGIYIIERSDGKKRFSEKIILRR